MFAHYSSLLALATVAVSAAAKPIVVRDSPVSLPIVRRVNTTSLPHIIEADKARAKVLKERSQGLGKDASLKQAQSFPFPVTNEAFEYVASVGVGTPPTYYNLIVDTGSSNTWVGANQAYVPTPSSHDTGEEVEVFYGSGFFFGEEYTDTVTIGNLIIPNQGVGVAEVAAGFNGLDGILGLGPVDLTEDTTSGGEEVPTVTNNAYTQGSISNEVLGISFEPTDSLTETNGLLTFGGVDSSKFTGDIAYVPITSTSPASAYVGIDQSITYGSSGIPILSSTAGITDTGTTLLYIASDAFSAYQAAIGAVLDSSTNLLTITQDQYDSLESLFFHIGDNTYEFTANAQIWPRALNTAIGGLADSIYLIVTDLGTPTGEGLDFIDGMVFLERFYYVYDALNNEVGFATTSYTDSEIN